MGKNYTCLESVARALKDHYDNWSKFSHNFCPDESKAAEKEDYIETVWAMKEEITKALNQNDDVELPKGASNVLINKIIMVTYGCIPAFDSRIRAEWQGLGYQRIDSGSKDWLNKDLLQEVYEFANHNRKELLDLPSKNGYSVFKKIDMILWEYGKTLGKNKEE